MKKILIFAAILFATHTLLAQEDETWRCATDDIYLNLIEKNPQILIDRQNLDEFVKGYIKNILDAS